MPLPTKAAPFHHTKGTWPNSRESRRQSAEQKSAKWPRPNYVPSSTTYPFSNLCGALLDRHRRFHVDFIANGLAHGRLDPSMQRVLAFSSLLRANCQLQKKQDSSSRPPPFPPGETPIKQKEPPSHLPRMHNSHQQPLVLETQPNLSRKKVGRGFAHPV